VANETENDHANYSCRFVELVMRCCEGPTNSLSLTGWIVLILNGQDRTIDAVRGLGQHSIPPFETGMVTTTLFISSIEDLATCLIYCVYLFVQTDSYFVIGNEFTSDTNDVFDFGGKIPLGVDFPMAVSLHYSRFDADLIDLVIPPDGSPKPITQAMLVLMQRTIEDLLVYGQRPISTRYDLSQCVRFLTSFTFPLYWLQV
jgi:hypothetical protein